MGALRISTVVRTRTKSDGVSRTGLGDREEFSGASALHHPAGAWHGFCCPNAMHPSVHSRRGPPSLVVTIRPLDSSGSKILRHRLDGPAITIGRAPANRVSLEAPTLSRVHASLEWRGPELRELWLSDLDSRNGTWFLTHGAARVRPCEPLRLLPGEDSFAVGPFWIAVDRWQPERHGDLPSVERVRLRAEAFVADNAKTDPESSSLPDFVLADRESAPASARRKRANARAR